MIELKPDFVKGYGRKGAALFGKGEFDLAKKAYEDGLKVDGSNETCKNGVQECEQKLDEDSKFKKVIYGSTNDGEVNDGSENQSVFSTGGFYEDLS